MIVETIQCVKQLITRNTLESSLYTFLVTVEISTFKCHLVFPEVIKDTCFEEVTFGTFQKAEERT